MERFWSKVQIEDWLDCWLWTACRLPTGYGRFFYEGRDQNAHRVAYQLMVGPIPHKYEVDHLCRVTSCVNPLHLEAVTSSENKRRGLTGKVNNPQTKKTHCPRGHSYADKRTSQGKRICLTCRREASRFGGYLRDIKRRD